MSSTLADDDAFSSTPTATSPRFRSTGRSDPIAALRLSVAEWNRRRRFRTELKRLLKIGPHVVADIGFTLDEAHEQIETPFWRP